MFTQKSRFLQFQQRTDNYVANVANLQIEKIMHCIYIIKQSRLSLGLFYHAESEFPMVLAQIIYNLAKLNVRK